MLETGKFVVSKLKSSEKPGRQVHLCVLGVGGCAHTHKGRGRERRGEWGRGGYGDLMTSPLSTWSP